MPGTLLAFDDAFPRAENSRFTVVNHPSAEELRAHSYPLPHQLLAIRREHSAAEYIAALRTAMQAMRRVECLILMGHGHVVQALQASGVVPITTGIVLGTEDLGLGNVSLLRRLRNDFARRSRCELWVCDAASPNASIAGSGSNLCQSIANALNVEVLASAQTQSYDSVGQEFAGDTVRSTVVFLPFEGDVLRFRPRRTR